ncbi:MAG: hypothetical protein PHV28_05120 [Kiritimatiellae bacterium]|nr:hypothetical protein [Kiritimatiellia bacterium]
MNHCEKETAAHSKNTASAGSRLVLTGGLLLALACTFSAHGGVVGTYDGFMMNMDPADNFLLPTLQGALTVIVRSEGGRLTVKAKTFTRTLLFNTTAWDTATEHVCTAVMTARGGERLTLKVTDGAKLEGTLESGSLGATILLITGGRNRFRDRGDTAAQEVLDMFSGYYTVSLPKTDVVWEGALHASPQGVGFVTMMIGNKGFAKIAGQLADGTRVSQSSRLIFLEGSPVGYVPFFVPLYRKAGWIGGVLTIDPVNGTAVAPLMVCWDKPGLGPDGFQMILDVCGGYYRSMTHGWYFFGWNYGPAPALAAGYLFYGDDPLGAMYHTPGGPADYVAEAVPQAIGVATLGTRLVMDKGVKPVKSADGTYAYPAGNSAMAVLRLTAKTGIFKGSFKLYSDYTSAAGKPVHKAVRVSYAGVLTPVRDAAYEDFPVGMGYYLVPDNDPSLAVYRLKRSFISLLKATP